MPGTVGLHETITVGRSAAECFRFTADFANIGDWDPSVTDAAQIVDGPLGVGTQFRVVVRSGARRIAMDYTIVTFEPDRRVVLHGRSEVVDAVDTIVFEPVATGTRIDYSAELTLKTVTHGVARALTPLLNRMGRRSVAGLRRALEPSGVAAPSAWRDVGDRLILPGALRFTRLGAGRQAIADRLDGQHVVLTGATSGLGAAAADRLARLGAELTLVGRDTDKLTATRDALVRRHGNAAIRIEQADLAVHGDVEALIPRLAAHGPIDALINNAGALFNRRELTNDGIERTFAVNLLAPYALMRGLADTLRSPGGRVINVASGGMYLQPLDLGDLEFARPGYDGAKAYAQAKRGLVALTQLLANEWADAGIAVHAMHPGWADTPGVADALPGFKRVMQRWLRTPEDGADTMVWLAACPAAAARSGAFWLDRAPHTTDVLPGTRVSAEQAGTLRADLDARLTRLATG